MIPEIEIDKKDAEKIRIERRVHEAFMFSVTLKGIGAVSETILGALLLFTNVLTHTILNLMDAAIIEDPDNFFWLHLRSLASLSPKAQLFGGLYLLTHGVVKVILVWGLLKEKMWAFPAAIVVLSLFSVYQLIKFFQTWSLGMLLLTIFDLIVVALVVHEYRQRVQPKS